MNIQQINEIVDNYLIPDTCKDIGYHEREYYWLIEGDNFFYKIYKPVKNSNFDFSTIEKRRNAINKELILNKRLANKIYNRIIAVKQITQEQNIEDNDDGKIIDYALVIKKTNPEHKLINLINTNEISLSHIDKIASKIAHFHSRARVIKNVFGITAFQQDLEQVLNFGEEIKTKYGNENLDFVKELIDYSNKYLNQNRNLLNDRTILGYIKDAHGAIIPENIYLSENDVFITDCEISEDSFRYIDVLNDIAALGMELDSLGFKEFSTAFYESYLKYSKTEDNFRTRELYEYYKTYRALKSLTNQLQKGSTATQYLAILHKYEPEMINS